MKKKIKSSKRGLTFSIESEAFPSGTRFSYLIDQKKKRILIIQSEEGKNTVSRKKSGNRYIPLFDIRANAVKECISQCDHMEIRVYKDTILIDLKGKVSSIIQIPRIALKATGTDAYYQTTVFDWMHESGIGSYEDQKTVSEQIPDVIKVISLFSGAGFLDHPFHEDDFFDIIYAVDQDPSACATYQENIGNHIVNADIHSISHLPKCNLVIGGPSCKAFSNANRKTRLDNHKDAGLISQYLRIVEETSPEVFVIENVPQFLTVFQGSNLKLIKDSFPEYDISSAIVDDSDLGGFTTRKRGIIIASKIGRIHIPKISLHKKKTVREALSKVSSEWFNYRDLTISSEETKRKMDYVPQGGNWKSIPDFQGKNMHSDRYYRLHPDKPSPTIVNWRKLPLIHPFENRTLTVAEAAALMGLDKHYKILGTLGEKQQQVGNGVPISIGKFIKKLVKKAFARNEGFSPVYV